VLQPMPQMGTWDEHSPGLDIRPSELQCSNQGPKWEHGTYTVLSLALASTSDQVSASAPTNALNEAWDEHSPVFGSGLDIRPREPSAHTNAPSEAWEEHSPVFGSGLDIRPREPSAHTNSPSEAWDKRSPVLGSGIDIRQEYSWVTGCGSVIMLSNQHSFRLELFNLVLSYVVVIYIFDAQIQD
jgi:hypothetical protein